MLCDVIQYGTVCGVFLLDNCQQQPTHCVCPPWATLFHSLSSSASDYQIHRQTDCCYLKAADKFTNVNQAECFNTGRTNPVMKLGKFI